MELNPNISHQEDGIGKVRVTLDANGNVTSAQWERRGSTITNSALINQLKAEAKKAKFRKKINHSGSVDNSGIITFVVKRK